MYLLLLLLFLLLLLLLLLLFKFVDGEEDRLRNIIYAPK